MEKIIMGVKSALDILSNFLFYCDFIHNHSDLFGQDSAFVTSVAYSQEQANHWFLF
ncbi:MAG TPA: hypothetical protein IAB62_02430 [Candidatus Coprocola pullicola]|nr:hypothetical protein [Candidatus Coprocola pullicola]